MKPEKFKALVVREGADNAFVRSIEERTTAELPVGELLVEVRYSSLNYKDMLSATGNRGVTKNYPHTPGIDAAGVVESSASPDFQPGDAVVVMDADLSHPPEKISEMVERITKGGADMVIGSRYVEGGHVENWPFRRRLMSKSATLLARGLTKVKDPMSGFFAIKREVVEGVELNPIGYKIALEILVKGKVSKVEEVPITFADRKAGKSKLGASVTLKYIDHCISLYEHRKPWLAKYLKFAFVGGEQMSGATYTLPSAVPVNTEIDISVTMVAPSKAGTLRGNWRMQTAAGQFFGDEVFVQIVVGGATLTPTKGSPTATPTATNQSYP